jgi:GNAT superfamily N-acetyltransferase
VNPPSVRSLAVKALAATCWSRLTILERELAEPLPDLGGIAGLEFGLLVPADALEYAALVPGSSATQLDDRLRAGHRGFGIRHQGRLIGVSWAALGRVQVPYLRGTLALQPDEALVHGAFVAEEMRGKQVSSQGGLYRLRWLRDAGYRRAVAAILPENTAAFGPPEKLGYRRIGTAYGVGAGPMRLVRVVPRSPATRSAKVMPIRRTHPQPSVSRDERR